MKPFKILSILFMSTLLVFLIACNKKSSTPNIILVITDDQGYGDVSAHGSPDVSTPNMDLLKSQSISLEDFQVSPTCAPTRSAILTGRHPFKNAITHTILERERMALGIPILPEVLKRAGYTSGIFGKWHLGDEAEYQPDSRGFDEVFIHGAGGIGQAYPGSCADVPDNKYEDPTIKHNGIFVKTKGFCTDVFFTQALSWIKHQSIEEKPFFAYITTNAPHGPFIAPEKYKKKFIEQGYPDNAQGFYGMIENIDDNLGALMKKMDEWGIAENTVLIFMSDNGKAISNSHNSKNAYNAGMKGYKGSIHEGGTRVPFFIRWPEKLGSNTQVNTLFNHYDILPTLAEIVGINITDLKDLDGRSFLSDLQSDEVEKEDRYRFVHRGRWPLNPQNINKVQVEKMWIGDEFTSNPDSSQYKNFAVRNEQYRFENNNALYDLYKDPSQTVNIASENPEIVKTMKAAYDEWWTDVRPLMVNENVPLAKERPFWKAYNAQQEASGIQEWKTPILD